MAGWSAHPYWRAWLIFSASVCASRLYLGVSASSNVHATAFSTYLSRRPCQQPGQTSNHHTQQVHSLPDIVAGLLLGSLFLAFGIVFGACWWCCCVECSSLLACIQALITATPRPRTSVCAPFLSSCRRRHRALRRLPSMGRRHDRCRLPPHVPRLSQARQGKSTVQRPPRVNLSPCL